MFMIYSLLIILFSLTKVKSRNITVEEVIEDTNDENDNYSLDNDYSTNDSDDEDKNTVNENTFTMHLKYQAIIDKRLDDSLMNETLENGMPIIYVAEIAGSQELNAHKNRVTDCKDHYKAEMYCTKSRISYFCEEIPVFAYSFCRKSCNYCDPNKSQEKKVWRLRSAVPFQQSWIISEINFYNQIGSKVPLNVIKDFCHPISSSDFAGYPAKNAFDGDVNTHWMPASWGLHSPGIDWIGCIFNTSVNIYGIQLLINYKHVESFQSSPKKILVEASDNYNGPYHVRWVINQKDKLTNTIHFPLECPVLWRKFEDEIGIFCYKLITKFLTWKAAESYCISEESHLVSINSQDENDFLSRYVKPFGDAWIGLNDLNEEGYYVWTVRQNLTGYVNWDSNETYSEIQRKYSDCVTINRHGLWYIDHCSNKNYFICKRKPNPLYDVLYDNTAPLLTPPFIFENNDFTNMVPTPVNTSFILKLEDEAVDLVTEITQSRSIINSKEFESYKNMLLHNLGQ